MAFTRLGSFAKLQAALGYETDHAWTDAERQKFLSSFTYFHAAFRKLGGEDLSVTPADARAIYRQVL